MDLDQITIMLRSFWTVWLMLLFFAIMAYAMWPNNRRKFDDAASIPLKDEGREL